ncbi:class I SAM-dependent methyltransferase [Microbaculum marinum]|uniref:Class I SAM-dependent methyltransferase n=1 Tax=Microbaculum marinum TaxID=1764581 RepID=A0AAW9RTW9_9HYPH
MPNAATGEEWDAEFREGRWRFLLDIKEIARTGAIAGWLRATDTGARVLDVGCGEGVLFGHLDGAALETYVGVDISSEALALAKVDEGRSRLVAADLSSFAPDPGEAFTAIVFNEVLHFADDPGAELRRYSDWLAPGGVIAVSMYAPWKETGGGYAKVRAMETACEDPYWDILDALELTSQSKNVRWRLRLIRPAA